MWGLCARVLAVSVCPFLLQLPWHKCSLWPLPRQLMQMFSDARTRGGTQYWCGCGALCRTIRMWVVSCEALSCEE